MAFSNKHSDIFYNDETKEMFVCTVSAITAYRCESSDLVYGALPLIYKIDKDTNYKQTVYPPNLDTFETDTNSDVYKLTPECAISDLNFDSITKPLINFNKDTSRYSVTFLGRYSSDVKGLVVNNYIFEDIDNRFHLLNAKSLLPQNSLSAINGRFTFDSNYLNSEYYVGGNIVRNFNSSWFNPAEEDLVERSPNYMVSPTHVESTSAIGFNLIQDNINTALDALTGNKNYPLLYSGGYITVNPKYAAFDPQQTIRIDFRARCFTRTTAPTAYGSTQSTGLSATRWVQQYSTVGPGEGFCVYLFEQPDFKSYVVPNGVGSTLGYCPAEFNSVEVAGSAHTTVGLFKRRNWNPNTGPDEGGNVGDGEIANSFIGIGFDIAGRFATTTEDKPGSYDGTTYTTTPCSVAVRGNRFTNNKVLTAIALEDVPGATSIPLHTSGHDANFVDYRIDLTNKGNRLTVSHKLTSVSGYNTILDLRLNKIQGSGAGNEYNPWEGFAVDTTNNEYPLLNVGLSFTTGSSACHFELHSFEVKGVKVNNPWEVKEVIVEEAQRKTRIDYINKSSDNLRKRLLNVQSDEDVNVEMVIPAKQNIANSLYEENNTTEITLCDDNTPDKVEEEVVVNYTGVQPGTIDKLIQATERGELIPEIGGNPIPKVREKQPKRFYEPRIKESKRKILPNRFQSVCYTGRTIKNNKVWWPKLVLFKSNIFKYKEQDYCFYIRTIEDRFNANTNTLNVYSGNINTLEEKWLLAVAEQTEYVKYWELHQVKEETFTSNSQTDYNQDPDNWFWLPKLRSDGTPYNEEDIEEWLTERYRGVSKHTVCIKIEDEYEEPTRNWDPTPDKTNIYEDQIEEAAAKTVIIDDEGSEIDGNDWLGASLVNKDGSTPVPPSAVETLLTNDADTAAAGKAVGEFLGLTLQPVTPDDAEGTSAGELPEQPSGIRGDQIYANTYEDFQGCHIKTVNEALEIVTLGRAKLGGVKPTATNYPPTATYVAGMTVVLFEKSGTEPPVLDCIAFPGHFAQSVIDGSFGLGSLGGGNSGI